MNAKYFRIVLVNRTGVTMTYNDGARINAIVGGFHVSPTTGKLTYDGGETETFAFTTDESLAEGAELIGETEFCNSTSLNLGWQVDLDITHDLGASTDGTIDIYLSTGSGTGALQTDMSGYIDAETNLAANNFVGSMPWGTGQANGDQLVSATFTL